jgi:CubicO group peptidase (beta-lactamase class C family)
MNTTFVTNLMWAAVAFVCAQAVCVGKDANNLSPERRFERDVDRIVTNRMEKAHIAGAVVVVVHDGKVLLTKGYGYANLESKRRVDPNKTLFRIASISKVFTAATAMKLIDAGHLDPDRDVRPLLSRAGLDFGEGFQSAITIRSLLSHSAGVRENFIPFATLATNVEGRLPLRDYLIRCAPLRWQEPGLSMLYSDTGIALAGYALELEARKPFHELVDVEVLQPLKMKRTCYIPKPHQLADVAMPYKHRSNGYVRADFLYTSIDPAIGVLTTGSDMAKFLRAHLDGNFLDPRGRELMYEVQFCDDERLYFNEAACGLFVDAGKRHRELYHSGWALGYQSSLVLVPGQRLGFFVAQNGNGPISLRMDEVQQLLFGTNSNPANSAKKLKHGSRTSHPCELENLAGLYVNNRQMSRNNDIEKCDVLQVTHVPEEGALDIIYNGDPKQKIRWNQIGPALFGSGSTDQIISFRHAPDGQTTFLIGYSGDGAHRKVLPRR